MASVCISIENETALTRFRHALSRAGSVAGDMIEVKTTVDHGRVVKVITSDCPGGACGLPIIRKAERVGHD